MANTIRAAVSQEWDVVAWDWSWGSYTALPWQCVPHAVLEGYWLGWQIRAAGYERAHLIGHSAGAIVIDRAVDVLPPNTKKHAHTTFLDAFVPSFGYGNLGDSSEWAEQYVDSRPSLDPFTNATLRGAYNVDVTDLDSETGASWARSHKWPWRWYHHTVENGYLDEEGREWGFGISQEAGQTLLSHDEYPRRHRICLPSGQTMYAPFVPALTLGDPLDLGATFSIPGETGITSVTGTTAVLETGSPVCLAFLVELSDLTNVMQFDYRFLSDAEGWLSVYFDGVLVHEADERFVPDAWPTEPVWLGHTYVAGFYWLSFRLDPFSGDASEVEIANVRFGYAEPIPEPITIISGLVAVGVLGRYARRRSANERQPV